MTATFAVVTGGGTAGHVLPALAIAEALVDAGHDPATVHYVGARRGIETRLVPPTPFPHTFLDVSGLQRARTLDGLRANARMLRRLAGAVRAAGALLDRLVPRVVVSVGGYASVPAVVAARRRRVPIVAVSYDRLPGLATRLTARVAVAAAVAFEDSPLRRAVVTGAPVRRAVRELDRAAERDAARVALGLPVDRFVVAVTGGSQGSGVVNAAVQRYVDDRASDAGLAVRQIVGDRFLAVAPPGRDGAAGVLHQVVGYDDHLERTYAACDVLVGRGGASTVAEVAAAGVPAVLVPWSGAAEDHQTLNVAWLAEQGAAVALAEGELATLGDVLDGLRADPDRLTRLGAAAHEAGAIHRSGRLAALIEDVARGAAAPGRPT